MLILVENHNPSCKKLVFALLMQGAGSQEPFCPNVQMMVVIVRTFVM